MCVCFAFTDSDEVHSGEEARAHRHQCLLRPLVEPVDAGAVDDGRELARTHA